MPVDIEFCFEGAKHPLNTNRQLSLKLSLCISKMFQITRTNIE